MVRMILDTIEENVDIVSLQGKPTPINYIYSKSRSPTEVRFDEAIGLFLNYVREYFDGFIPARMACVDRVGGVFTLSKNLKNLCDSSALIARNQSSEAFFGNDQRNSLNIFNPIISNNAS